MESNRRPRLAVLSLLILSMIMASGCGKKAEVPELYNYEDLTEYIKLAEYKGIEYTRPDETVSEDEVRDYIQKAVADTAERTEVTSGTVKEDSVVNIDYTGSIDGVEFEGGAATGVEFDIANSNYIDGFAEGIVGHDAGETFDLHVTFPENYGNEELNGKDAVFKTKINYILEIKEPVYDDKWVKANTEYSSVKEYEKSVRDKLISSKKSDSEGSERLEVFNKIIKGTEVISYPEKELNARYSKIENTYKGFAEANGQSFEDYLSANMGITPEQFKETADSAAKDAVKQELVLNEIAKLEGITISDSDYNNYLLQLLEDAGYTEESYKEEKGYTIQKYAEENDLYTSCLYQKVMDKVMEYALEKK